MKVHAKCMQLACEQHMGKFTPIFSKFIRSECKIFGVKGIVGDSNNIFLWHESEDINKKSWFPKFQLIPIPRFQVMHVYVCFIVPQTTVLNEVLCTRLSVKIALISHWNDFSLIPLGIVLLKGELWKYAKNSNFENFKSTLYSTSVNMPLIIVFFQWNM